MYTSDLTEAQKAFIKETIPMDNWTSMKVQNRSAKILDTRNRFSSLPSEGDAQRRGRPSPPPRAKL